MTCWEIVVTLGGRDFTIPALPAVEWWPVLIDLSPSALLDLISATPDDPVGAMLLTGEVSRDDLETALTDVIEEVTGRSMHAAVVLALVAQAQWPVIGGQLARGGFRWDVQPIGAALDAIYSIVLDGVDEEGRKKFLALLENETGKPSGRRIEAVNAEFESMAGPRPAPAPVPGQSTAGLSGSARPRTRTRPRQRPQDGRSAEPTPQPGPPAGNGPPASS